MVVHSASTVVSSAFSDVRVWRLHLGAHKTATTHLQMVLDGIRPALAARGVDAIPHKALRPLSHQVLPRKLSWQRWIIGPWTSRSLNATLAPLRCGPDVVLLSEENFLGSARDAVARHPYPDLVSRLRVLASLGEGAELSLFFSIRQMDRFLPSAYAQALRFFTFEEHFETLGPRLAADPPRWTEVIARIRRAIPNASLTVWRYEDYARNSPDILATVCGTDPGPLPKVRRPKQTQTPSAAAVLAAERLERGLNSDAYVAEVERIYAASPAGPSAPAFYPFRDAERAGFERAYEADCRELAEAGLLLRF